MKTIFGILVVITLFSSALAQKSKLDSLKTELIQAKHDTILFNLYIDIGEEFENSNPDSSFQYYCKGLQLAESNNFKKKKSSALSHIGYIYRKQGNFQKSIEAYINALHIDEELGDKYGIAKNYNNIGLVHYELGNYDNAIEFLQKSLQIKEEIEDKMGIAASYSNIGIIYKNKGHFDKAIEQYLKSLKILEELNDKEGIAKCYNNIGSVYYSDVRFDKALEYFQKSMKISEELNDNRGLSRSYNNIGIIYKEQKNYEKAIEFYHKALNISITLGDKKSIAIAYNNIGNIHRTIRSYDKTVEYYLKSLKIREEIGDKRGLTSIYCSIAEFNLDLADSSSGLKRNYYLNEAVNHGLKAYNIALEIGALPQQSSASFVLKNAYSKLGNYREALRYADIRFSVNDSIFNQEKNKALTEMQTKYETEKKQQEIEKQQLIIEKGDIDYRRQRTQLKFFFAGSVLLGLLVLVTLIAYRQKNSSNIIISEKNALLEQYNEEVRATSEALTMQNEQLKAQNEEITNQRNEIESQRNALANIAWELQDKSEEIESQRNILSLQHKEITDSIVYAQRIQKAVLPSADFLNQLFAEHLILYKPKSIVSGDFYWTTRIRELLVFCVSDCTGHGVPGAFMSMMGVSFLNEIVRKEEVTNAAQVLNELREHVVNSMVELEGNFVQLDGMDIGICVLNTQTLQMQFAGANIGCWIATTKPSSMVINGKIELQCGLVELKSNSMPIGRYQRMDPFTQIECQLNTNDIIYLATDGFADQFGGAEGKKFQKSRLMELLAQNVNLPLADQNLLLDATFEEWKEGRNQLDDVTVLGIKV